MDESSCAEDPWDKWVLNKAREQHRNQVKREEEIRVSKEQEMFRLEKDRMRGEKNREVYARWVSEKKRAENFEVAEREKLDSEQSIEREQKDEILKQRAKENYHNWTRLKREEAAKHAHTRHQETEKKKESKKLNRLRAAEAYEQWLIEHPFRVLPESSYVNPNPWVEPNDDQD